ncbi:nuclear receptor subfamily 1 group I member 2 [Plectropomus leopardus]|uniref:nuclear receptor subfamily 1 group I member 2 n=1 Tax=Plectropomus leopardus TaxID=160734 RepID=UPI001C4D37A6|nr:nuclear receptor subfamily 1 group I member 2 [Plectropomus leopardus]
MTRSDRETKEKVETKSVSASFWSLKFGDSLFVCRSDTEWCGKCGGHDCDRDCVTEPECVLCKGHHAAWEATCPQRVRAATLCASCEVKMNKDTGVQSILQALASHDEEEDEERKVTENEESRACGVYGDLAKGYHLNAVTCEGCKGFSVVMSEEEVLVRRIRFQTRKVLYTPVQLSFQQEETIQELLCGHRNSFDSAFYRFSGYRVFE